MERSSSANNGQCSLQNGEVASCVSYEKCSPFVKMMKNLRKPLPTSIPKIMQEVFLCGLTSDNLPMVCCPNAAVGSAVIEEEEQPMLEEYESGTILDKGYG